MLNKIWDENGIFPIRKTIQPVINYKDKLCLSPYHQPPSHLYIPMGEIHIHKCPQCGNEIIMRGKDIFI